MSNFRDLKVYQKAIILAMDIFEISKSFPQDERYGLISQIRNSSRSVCSSIGEAYRKRRYPKHLISKLSDADMENTETQVWADFALASNYISKEEYDSWNSKSEEIGRMLQGMMEKPERFS